MFCAGRETINRRSVSGRTCKRVPGMYLVYTTHGPLRINVAFHGELITRSKALSSGPRERKNRRSRLTHRGTRVPNRFNGTTVTRSERGSLYLRRTKSTPPYTSVRYSVDYFKSRHPNASLTQASNIKTEENRLCPKGGALKYAQFNLVPLVLVPRSSLVLRRDREAGGLSLLSS